MRAPHHLVLTLAAAVVLVLPAAACADPGHSAPARHAADAFFYDPDDLGVIDRSTLAAEPPLQPTPQGECGPGSRPETGIQGRVSRADHESGLAAKGITCNTEMVGSYTVPSPKGSVGGFKTIRYVDAQGNECAYYDTTLMFPTNVFDLTAGVNVLDMNDPSDPKLVNRLVTPAMLSPHESLVVSEKRGVLAAVLGNAANNVGVIDLYDISADCRNPVFKSSTPIGAFGHESGMAPDGRTFYSASPVSMTIVAVDITNLSAPVPLWAGHYFSHGLSISPDGNRAYVATVGGGVTILDTSEVQARVTNPQVREVARLGWRSMSIPQNALPVEIDGDPYLVEIDEFGAQSEVGAGRIIDISDEAKPRVVSNLRLAVHQPANFDAQADDPGVATPFQTLQGYAGHYCWVPRYKDPGIAACSMIVSGLRIFDIRNPRRPKEIAYFNAPVKERTEPEGSSWAMSAAAFAPERNEVWYTDGYSGFYAVRLTNGVWPADPVKLRCGTRRIAHLRGNPLDEVLRGTRRRDAISGRGGSDRIDGRKSGDCLRGGAGIDRLRGGNGGDRIRGGGGADILRGGRGDDHLTGSPGDDSAGGGAGGDLIRGGRGDDALRGGRGPDILRGGSGDDELFGGPGPDHLVCGAGRDTVHPGAGDTVDRSCERLA